MQLSKHFSLEVFIRSETALRHGIDNTPNDEQIEKLRWLAQQFEDVRALVGPLHCNSVFRCLEVNRKLGSKDTSQHVKCEAGDLISLAGLTPYQLCKTIVDSSIAFDQVIYEFSSWMHISFVQSPKIPRRQVLTINAKYPSGIQGLIL